MKTLILALATMIAGGGCYHYTFEQRKPTAGTTLVTYTVHRPTYLNGFVGNGTVDASKYCAHPVKTELVVRASDVALSMLTLLIYTPHTLQVTCEYTQVGRR